jgi:hypothetical protein
MTHDQVNLISNDKTSIKIILMLYYRMWGDSTRYRSVDAELKGKLPVKVNRDICRMGKI